MEEALNWWNNLPTAECFRLLKKHGYQEDKKPWKYRPLTNKGIFLIWSLENKKETNPE